METIKTKFSQAKEWAKAHKKGIIIVGSAVTGVALTYVGFKHYKGSTTGANIGGDEVLTILSEVPVSDLTQDEVEVFEELVEKM